MDRKLLKVAKGEQFADLVVNNGNIVNVYSGEIYQGGVAVSGDKIAAIGDVDYCIGEETIVVDAKGQYLTPGFVEGHIHPESSSLSVRNFAEALLQHGTTSVMADFHEIGVVSGIEGIAAILNEARETHINFGFVVPSHVPFSPNLETSGAHFDSEIIEKALEREDAVGLSECVGQYILMGFPDLMNSMEIAKSKGKTLHGHLPGMHGKEMSACIAAGVTTDHEGYSEEDVLSRLRNGCHLMMRDSSAARNLPLLLKTVLDNDLDTSLVSIVTDDLNTIDLYDHGHLDNSVRTALSLGCDFIKAIQMVTVTPARAFGKENEIGGLAPGRRADINITSGPEDFKVRTVIAKGDLVCEDGEMLVSYSKAEHDKVLLNTVNFLEPITADSFKIRVHDTARKVRVLVMDTLQYIPFTERRDVELDVIDGVVQCDPEQDVLHIAQIERHGINGNIGKAFMGGFKFRGGSLASSVGHDNHNVIVLGDDFDDMAIAANRVQELGGGQVVVVKGKIVVEVAYSICGLLSDLPIDELVQQKKALNNAVHALGSEIAIPFMFLTFICLAAIPDYAITDHGLIDVTQQEVIDPILEIID